MKLEIRKCQKLVKYVYHNFPEAKVMSSYVFFYLTKSSKRKDIQFTENELASCNHWICGIFADEWPKKNPNNQLSKLFPICCWLTIWLIN